MTDQPDIPPEEALRALTWLTEMGADEAVGDEPVNQFEVNETARAEDLQPEPAEAAPPQHPPISPAPAAARALTSPDDAVSDARKLAQSCQSLEEIVAALDRFDGCPLKRTATNLCFADGNPAARVLVIGEAPGRDEDRLGKPFVGRSGQLLDKMLAAIGLSRNDPDPQKAVYITNVIYWRPPGNRKPTEAETLMCMPFVNRTIELMAPQFIVCAGATPTQRLLGRTEGILRLRGRWFTLQRADRETPLLATLHPAYLLRQPAQKRLAWRDLLDLKTKLLQAGAGNS